MGAYAAQGVRALGTCTLILDYIPAIYLTNLLHIELHIMHISIPPSSISSIPPEVPGPVDVFLQDLVQRVLFGLDAVPYTQTHTRTRTHAVCPFDHAAQTMLSRCVRAARGQLSMLVCEGRGFRRWAKHIFDLPAGLLIKCRGVGHMPQTAGLCHLIVDANSGVEMVFETEVQLLLCKGLYTTCIAPLPAPAPAPLPTPAPAHLPRMYLVWLSAMMMDAPEVNPEITACDKKLVTHPRRTMPTPVYMQATMKASWMTWRL